MGLGLFLEWDKNVIELIVVITCATVYIQTKNIELYTLYGGMIWYVHCISIKLNKTHKV